MSGDTVHGLNASEWQAVADHALNDLERLKDDFATVGASLGLDEDDWALDVTGGRVQAIVRAISRRNLIEILVRGDSMDKTCRIRLPALPRIGDDIWLGDEDANTYVVKTVRHGNETGIELTVRVPNHRRRYIEDWDQVMSIEQAKYEAQS